MHKKSSSNLKGVSQVFLIIIPFLLTHTLSYSQPISQAEKNWLAERVQAPSTSIMFNMSMNASNLRLDEDPDHTHTKDLPTSIEELDARLLKDPQDAQAAEKRFQILSKRGEMEEAFQGIQKTLNSLLESLDKDPGNYDLVSKANGIFFFAGEGQKSIRLTEFFLKTNPDNAEAKAFLAMQFSMMGRFENARTLIDEAYLNDPKLEDVYVAEWSYQWMQTIVKLNESDDLPLKEGFELFERALKEHPELIAPQLAMHSLTLSRALVLAVLKQQEAFIEEKPFTFELDSATQSQVNADKVFFQKLIDKSPANPYFLLKSLCIALVLEGEIDQAEKYFQKSEKVKHGDTDIHRIMTIGRITEAKFAKAAEFVNKSFQVTETPENLLLYARLMSDQGNPQAAVEALKASQASPTLELELGMISYLIQSENWKEANERMAGLTGGYQGDNETTYHYLSGITSLANGDLSSAKMTLYIIKDDAHYSDSVKEIIDFFELE